METRKVDVILGDTLIKKDFEIPEFWSDRAATIVGSKYATDTENSVLDIIDRVVNQISTWGIKQGYFIDNPFGIEKFSDKLKDILLDQRASFNSPVWFNCGVEKNCNQMSACFILPIEDTMESILNYYSVEGNIFKGGSGAGTNISDLRGKGEKLSNKGEASGPVSFMRGFDKSAGTIKSGGKVRRAAKMVCMNVDHPDIEEFIACKTKEEEKAKILIKGGVDEKEAYDTVDFQNTNHSIRVNNEFMLAVKENKNYKLINRGDKKTAKTVSAKDILMKVAENAWSTGDPGIQYDDAMNKDNPVPSLGRIRSTNPCFAGETLLHTKQGLRRIEDLTDVPFHILCHDGVYRTATAFPNGTKSIYKVTLSSGNELFCTEDHRLLESRKTMEFVEAGCVDSKVELGFFQKPDIGVVGCNATHMELKRVVLVGYATGDGTPRRIQDKETYAVHNARIYLRKDGDDNEVGTLFKETFSDWKKPKDKKESLSSGEFTLRWAEYNPKQFIPDRFIPQEILEGDIVLLGGFLKGLFSANGSVQPKHSRVSLKTTSKRLAVEVVNALSVLGIHSYITTNKKKMNKFSNSTYEMKESYDVNITKKCNLTNFATKVSFVQTSKRDKLKEAIDTASENTVSYRRPFIKSIEFVREDIVYDFTESETHTGVANGIVVHNCSEFSAIDNSSCNLASLNLLSYWGEEEDGLDWALLEEDIKILVTAMDILIDAADYPTQEIREITTRTRPLGLGFSNLGALLMTRGIPYDSEEARDIASDITRFITAEAYRQSAQLAKKLGCFYDYPSNINKCIEIAMRLSCVNKNDQLYKDIKEYGLRNSQLTLLAPTGTISFMMDCDSTGIEPLLYRKTIKNLVGGGTIEMTPKCIEAACQNIREKTGTKAFDLQIITDISYKDVFATANEISWKGHIDMMAACQKHLNGAISKTVNMPTDCTPEDIMEVYQYGWEFRLKAIAVYRDGSKGMQPLTEAKDEEETKETEVTPEEKWTPVRRKLPDTCYGPRHKFNIGGFKGYIKVSTYKDGTPGELFIIASKNGSTIQGLLDSFATSISLALQYGVPLEKLIDKFTGTTFLPSGFTMNEEIRSCSSIIDYVFKWMRTEFIYDDEDMQTKTEETPVPVFKEIILDGPVCSNPLCGGMTQRNGTCFVCTMCGETSGCS